MPSIRLLTPETAQDIQNIFERIHVDPYGIRIMAPKSETVLIELSGIPSLSANILKQEMLSCGADCAVPRSAIASRLKNTSCVLIGNLAQYERLCAKLVLQPFGLAAIGKEISRVLKHRRKAGFTLKTAGRSLVLGNKTRIMGIANVTPDSFSGDGLACRSADEAVDYCLRLIDDGADVIDIGGESSRPGARPVPLKEELSRTVPVIQKLAKKTKTPISVDTCKPRVACQAIDAGAAIVNDISGLSDPAMVRCVARSKAAVVIMHMKGRPRTMQQNPVYGSLMGEITGYLSGAVDRALQAGVAPDRIMIDPGIGFGKTLEHNLQILRNLRELKAVGMPVLVGASRKSFLGKILGVPAGERLMGSVASAIIAAERGAHMVRVHDVAAVAQALKITDAVFS